MKDRPSTLPENRALTTQEKNFIAWVLEHGNERARSFLPQIEKAWVTSRCGCGCASIDLSIDGVTYYGTKDMKRLGMELLAEFQWNTKRGALCAVSLFAVNGLLAVVDLWSVDGKETASQLPSVSALEPTS
jgi:hypothetical protein